MQLLSEPNADLEMTSLLMWRADDFGRALYSKSSGFLPSPHRSHPKAPASPSDDQKTVLAH